MPSERSAGAIIFRKEGDKTLFLLLHYPPTSHRTAKDYWDLAKGHIEPGETEGKTVRREVEEETGLKDIEFFPKFREAIKYFFKWEGKTVFKTVAYYLVETKTKEIKISSEHVGFDWLPFEEAMARLTFKNARDILDRANKFLHNISSGYE